MDAAAALSALAAAGRAWENGRGPWPAMGLPGRTRSVESFLDRIVPLRDRIVTLLMWEVGKSLVESRKEFDRTIYYIRSTIEAAGEAALRPASFTGGGTMARIEPAPVGVCLVMGPYNNPLYETWTNLAPALLLGNTAVVKPPRFGRLLHQMLLPALGESFPPGVVNVVSGNDERLIGAIMEHGDVDILSFVGSSRTANLLCRLHPKPARLRTVLGLDAKNPAVVMADADIDGAVAECVRGALSLNGQRCTALKIIFVHESIAGPFLERCREAVEALRAGMPWDEGVKITPLPDEEKARSMAAYVEDAVARGARVVNAGGGESCATLFLPALLYPVSPDAHVYHREQFGPVVPVCPYRDEEEVLRFLAASDYGQQASVFGTDPVRIGRVVRGLVNQVSRVNINCRCRRSPDELPFAGRKDSGNATMSVAANLGCFSIPSVVAAPSHPPVEDVLPGIFDSESE